MAPVAWQGGEQVPIWSAKVLFHQQSYRLFLLCLLHNVAVSLYKMNIYFYLFLDYYLFNKYGASNSPNQFQVPPAIQK